MTPLLTGTKPNKTQQNLSISNNLKCLFHSFAESCSKIDLVSVNYPQLSGSNLSDPGATSILSSIRNHLAGKWTVPTSTTIMTKFNLKLKEKTTEEPPKKWMVCGNNYWSQTGLGIDKDMLETFTEFVTPTPIAQISGGRDHTLALGINGSLWSWGRNDEGQLGIDIKFSATPKKVEFFTPENPVIYINAGHETSAAITS